MNDGALEEEEEEEEEQQGFVFFQKRTRRLQTNQVRPQRIRVADPTTTGRPGQIPARRRTLDGWCGRLSVEEECLNESERVRGERDVYYKERCESSQARACAMGGRTWWERRERRLLLVRRCLLLVLFRQGEGGGTSLDA
jgi:hypothetical protein